MKARIFLPFPEGDNKCHFCSEAVFFKSFRIRSGNSLFEEVKYQLALYPNVTHFIFCDSIINGSVKALRQFSELLLENNVKIKWGGQGTIHKKMTPELLNLMAKAGCTFIAYGFESASEGVRKKMNKLFFTNELAINVLKETHNAGIQTSVGLMTGYPLETEDDLQKTIDFIRQNREWIDSIDPSLYFTVILPETYLFKNPEEFGVNPDIHYLFWESSDGTNTYPIREKRFERFIKSARDLGYKGHGISTERPNKWTLLGGYCFYRADA
ncbi:MAG: radical SAM protein [Colwellia sp.]|nr:radical SAM protein [Colwellia sp.]